MWIRLFTVLTAVCLVAPTFARAEAGRCEVAFEARSSSYFLTSGVEYLNRAANDNATNPTNYALVKNGWVETSDGFVRAGSNRLGLISSREFVTELLERQERFVARNESTRPAFEEYKAQLLRYQARPGYLTKSDFADISHQTTLFLANIFARPEMQQTTAGLRAQIDQARENAFRNMHRSYFEANLRVPSDLTLDPGGFVSAGDGPFQRRGGDLYLLTEDQIASLARGTILVNFRTGEEVLTGISRLPSSRVNGFTEWGTPPAAD